MLLMYGPSNLPQHSTDGPMNHRPLSQMFRESLQQRVASSHACLCQDKGQRLASAVLQLSEPAAGMPDCMCLAGTLCQTSGTVSHRSPVTFFTCFWSASLSLSRCFCQPTMKVHGLSKDGCSEVICTLTDTPARQGDPCWSPEEQPLDMSAVDQPAADSPAPG